MVKMERYNFENNILMKIREGAEVVDKNNKKIGKVDDVFLGAVDRVTQEQAAGPHTTGVDSSAGGEEAPPNFAFGGAAGMKDDANQAKGGAVNAVRDRLLRNGYVHVNTGLLRSDRIVQTEQIQKVEEEKLILNVEAEKLLSDDILE